VPDTGLVVTELAGYGVEITIEDLVRPEHDAHVRHVTVKNVGHGVLQDVDLAYYSYYTLENFPQGDSIRFDGSAFLQHDNHSAVATLADRAPAQAHCGNILNAWGNHRDSRSAAENDDLTPCTPETAGLGGVNGTLVHRLSNLQPGQSTDITYAFAMGTDEGKALAEAKDALAGDFASRKKEDADRWSRELARANVPANLPANAVDVFRRAIITILQHRVDNGGFIAASTLTSPVYRLIWPRDGSKTAIDMLETGYTTEAKSFFELLETLQKPDGSFAINYNPDGKSAFFDFGGDQNENDQPGMLPWGVNRVFEATGDREWAAKRWPAIERAADFLVSVSKNGLIGKSRDLWELETGSSWTYSNGSAIAGLEATAKLAAAIGKDGSKYAERAKSIRAAMDRQLVTADGWFGRGSKNGRLDGRLEIANLALASGGFDILPDNDPRIAKLGGLVASRLGTPGGAVRRYEGDRYYGGQPWPVANAWLAIHKLAVGDRAKAEALFDNMTDQARATDTLMLGEQFDEGAQAWLSAVPLVWSEAAYLRTAKLLYGK
jgi:glucoamylase